MYNGHGDVTALLDASNSQIKAAYSYDEWGKLKDNSKIDGEFEKDDNKDGKDDGWIYSANVTSALVTSPAISGGKAQQIKTTSTTGSIHRVFATVAGHKYLFAGSYYIVSKGGNLSTRVNNEGNNWNLNLGSVYWSSTLNQWKEAGVVFTATGATTSLIPCFVDTQTCEVYIDKWKLIDLTELYGSGNEPATAAAAMADFDNSIMYAGYQYDKETGLYYLNARMYDPAIARFLQEDTYTGDAKDPLSLNLYTYCHNEPIMYWDPSGHKTQGRVLSYSPNIVDPSVAELQAQLNVFNFKGKDGKPLKVDGKFGENTLYAVNNFKRYYELTNNSKDTSGKVGDTTWAALGLTYNDWSKVMANSGGYLTEDKVITQIKDRPFVLAFGAMVIESKLFGTSNQTIAVGNNGKVDISKLEGSSLNEILTRLPSDAEKMYFQRNPTRIAEGYKFEWTDKAGNLWELYAHSPDKGAPNGANSRDNWTLRIVRYNREKGGVMEYVSKKDGSFIEKLRVRGPQKQEETHFVIKDPNKKDDDDNNFPPTGATGGNKSVNVPKASENKSISKPKVGDELFDESFNRYVYDGKDYVLDNNKWVRGPVIGVPENPGQMPSFEGFKVPSFGRFIPIPAW
jgi:RHS repeat-associated protein